MAESLTVSLSLFGVTFDVSLVIDALFTEHDGVQVAIRTFSPQKHGHHYCFVATLSNALSATAHEISLPEAAKLYRLIALMRDPHQESRIDLRRSRQFNIATFFSTLARESRKKVGPSTFDVLRQFMQPPSFSPRDLLLRCAGDSNATLSQLLMDAIFVKPEISASTFDNALMNVQNCMATGLPVIENTFEKVSEIVAYEGDIRADGGEPWTVHESETAGESSGGGMTIGDFLNTIPKPVKVNPPSQAVIEENHFLETGLVNVATSHWLRHAKEWVRVSRIVKRAAHFLKSCIDVPKNRAKPTSDTDNPVAIEELIDHCVSLSDLDTFLDRMIALLTETRESGVLTSSVRQSGESPSFPTSDHGDWLQRERKEYFARRLNNFLGDLEAARRRTDLRGKVSTIGWVAAQLDEALRWVQPGQSPRAALEWARHDRRLANLEHQQLLGFLFKQIYRKIRKNLSPTERRLFLLMYLPNPALGYRIIAADPVLTSFFTGMDRDTQNLILAALVFDRRERGGKDLETELLKLFRAYLRFYPYWVVIMQDDDRENKRKRLSSCDAPLSQDCTDGLTLADVLADPKVSLSDRQRILKMDNVRDWAKSYCTPRQARLIHKYFVEEKTEGEIALEEGVTQQAVSKTILAGLRKIRQAVGGDYFLEK